ncbi:MAG TPA: hypothetical protein VK186_23995 [Candidatus Deferrimicrobium sp.]|nr:hypothetical protein [Candidatus Kapabacteria bacterium]HLP61926.1 hypothetical protein [Candidatus Deferrimicrobium sp.]
MKRLFLLGVMILMLFPLMSNALVVGLNDDVHFDYRNMMANDFHIEGVIYSVGPITPTVTNILIFGDPGTGNWVVSQYCLIPDGPGRWKFYADFKTDGYINFCQWIHFGIMFNVQAKNIIADLIGWWTLDGMALQAETNQFKQVSITGFDVYGTGPEKMYKITNNTNIPIVVEAVELAVSNQAVPLENMFTTGLGRVNEPSPMYPNLVWKDVPGLPIMLQPGTFFEVRLIDMGIMMLPGQFLQIKGEQYMEGTKIVMDGKEISLTQTTPDWGWFWEQHGE